MSFLIPVGIGVSYVIFWFAMTQPVAGTAMRHGAKLLDKVGRGRVRTIEKCDSKAVKNAN